jgi:hypothetical protein
MRLFILQITLFVWKSTFIDDTHALVDVTSRYAKCCAETNKKEMNERRRATPEHEYNFSSFGGLATQHIKVFKDLYFHAHMADQFENQRSQRRPGFMFLFPPLKKIAKEFSRCMFVQKLRFLFSLCDLGCGPPVLVLPVRPLI